MNFRNYLKAAVFTLIFTGIILIGLKYTQPVLMWQIKNSFLAKISTVKGMGKSFLNTRQLY